MYLNKALSILLLLAAGAAWGQGSRVGFVDMSRIDDEAPQIEFVRDKLQAEFADREHELLDQQNEIRSLEGRLDSEADSLGTDERLALERALQRSQRNWKRKQEEFREDYIIRKNQEMEDLTRNITDTIRDFARAEKFDVILLTGVVYASDAADVTGRVLEWLERKQQQEENERTNSE